MASGGRLHLSTTQAAGCLRVRVRVRVRFREHVMSGECTPPAHLNLAAQSLPADLVSQQGGSVDRMDRVVQAIQGRPRH